MYFPASVAAASAAFLGTHMSRLILPLPFGNTRNPEWIEFRGQIDETSDAILICPKEYGGCHGRPSK